jgi:hypothetical protein
MKINRYHRFERKKTYEEMLEIGKGFSTTQVLWEYYWNSDETILATSSENLTNTSLDIHIHVPKDERKLFRTRGLHRSMEPKKLPFLEHASEYCHLLKPHIQQLDYFNSARILPHK